MSGPEHLAWAKQRAIEFLDRGDIKNALTSLASDLTKSPETATLARRSAGETMALIIGRASEEQVREYINGITLGDS